MSLTLLTGGESLVSVALKLARYAGLIEYFALDFHYVGVCRITASGVLYCASWGEVKS
jgi:hypothetical protein